MKKFIKNTLLLISAVIFLMMVLDYCYTKIYEECKPRTKFQYLRSLKDKKIEYIFLGSSRVENAIIPKIIKNKTGKEAVNLGFQASKLQDIFTVLKLVNELNIENETVFIQIDYIFNLTSGRSNILEYEMIPFISENEVISSHLKKQSKGGFLLNYYVPFYRYCRNDLKLGFREVFLNLMNKKSKLIDTKGYIPLKGYSEIHDGRLPEKIEVSNKIFDSIIKFCSKNKIKVVFYCAPFCKHTKNLEFIKKLKHKIPDLKDFSKVIIQNDKFQNCSDLNNDGAETFTEIFVKELLQ